jgi:hypothetical protein
MKCTIPVTFRTAALLVPNGALVQPLISERRRTGRPQGERRTVERGEALGIAERIFGLDAYDTTGLNNEPTVRRVAEINGDMDIGQRAKRWDQRERDRTGSRRNCTPELYEARDFLDCRTASGEWGVGPAIDERQRRRTHELGKGRGTPGGKRDHKQGCAEQ